MPPKKKQSADVQIYQLKITLKHFRPPIWRRVQVPNSMTLDVLHEVIQEVMGWQNYHMHQFKVGSTYYGMSYPDDFDEVTRTKNEKVATLSDLLSKPKAKCVYEYDFGDSWEHEIVLEKILSPEPGVRYPACLDGKRACPPEDCGGVWGYANLLEIIQDPNHPEHEEMLDWVGGSFDPEAFDVGKVNRGLKRIRQ